MRRNRNRWREMSTTECGRRLCFIYQCVRSGCIYCLLVWTLASFLTTATQPRAGILSLMAERWLKRLLPRFLSLKFWISWIWSEIGFSKSWSSICRGRRGRGVSVGEQLMEQHAICKDCLEGMTVWDNPSPPLLPVPSPFYWNLQCSALALLPFPLPIVPFLQTFLGSRGDPSVHVKAYGFSSVYTSPIPTPCACIQEHGVSSANLCPSFCVERWTYCCGTCFELSWFAPRA